jgi:hypothetical protein
MTLRGPQSEGQEFSHLVKTLFEINGRVGLGDDFRGGQLQPPSIPPLRGVAGPGKCLS